jgi:hypothetical protein
MALLEGIPLFGTRSDFTIVLLHAIRHMLVDAFARLSTRREVVVGGKILLLTFFAIQTNWFFFAAHSFWSPTSLKWSNGLWLSRNTM